MAASISPYLNAVITRSDIKSCELKGSFLSTENDVEEALEGHVQVETAASTATDERKMRSGDHQMKDEIPKRTKERKE